MSQIVTKISLQVRPVSRELPRKLAVVKSKIFSTAA